MLERTGMAKRLNPSEQALALLYHPQRKTAPNGLALRTNSLGTGALRQRFWGR